MFIAIDAGKISTFFMGLVAGVTLVFAVILIMLALSKKESRKIGSTIEDITKDKINGMIKASQDEFQDDIEEKELKYLPSMLDVSSKLIKDVASHYFPDSKHPEYELTIKEATDLIKYIVNEFEKIMNKPGIKALNSIRVSNIAEAIEKSQQIKKHKNREKTEKEQAVSNAKHVAEEVYKEYKIVKNTINPIYWFRRVVVKGTLNAAVKKLCKAGINIIGNEANRIYSKKDEAASVPVSEDFEEIYNEGD